MVGTANSVKVVCAEFRTPILPNIVGELTQESLIDIHRIISGSRISLASNLSGGRNGHLVLNMTAEDYLEQMGHAFLPSHNRGYYPPKMGTAIEQALGTERLQQNQALYQQCTAVDRAIKIKSYRRCSKYLCHQSWINLQDLGNSRPYRCCNISS